MMDAQRKCDADAQGACVIRRFARLRWRVDFCREANRFVKLGVAAIN